MIPTKLVAKRPKPFDEALEYMVALGYGDEGRPFEDYKGIDKGHPEAKRVVGRYQDFFKDPALIVDEIYGPVTEFHLSQPRCSMPDIVHRRASQAKWGAECKHNITWAAKLGAKAGLTSDEVAGCWLWGLSLWQDAADLTFVGTDDWANAMIQSQWGSMSRNTLGYAYYPQGCGDQVETYFNRAVSWFVAYLREVMGHEIGHLLGIEHQPNGNIMQPTGTSELDKLGPADLRAVYSRYDKRTAPVPTPTPPTPDQIETLLISVKGRGLTFETKHEGGETAPGHDFTQ